jgi:hypothetical protein
MPFPVTQSGAKGQKMAGEIRKRATAVIQTGSPVNASLQPLFQRRLLSAA